MITITSPKKGVGQTVTSINIAIKIGELLEDKILLIDSNQYCCGVVEYLSNSSWTRGLDEFKINMESGYGVYSTDNQKWSKNITPRLDIMASNQYVKIDYEDVKRLKDYIEGNYPVTVVDSIAGENPLTRTFLQQSKMIIVVLTQDQNQIRLIRDKRLYQEESGKVVFVINQYRDRIDDVKIKYGVKEIRQELKELGFTNNPVYTLPYDGGLLNECNDSTLLNYSLSKEYHGTPYNVQMEDLSREILKNYGDFQIFNMVEEVREKGSIFDFRNLREVFHGYKSVIGKNQ